MGWWRIVCYSTLCASKTQCRTTYTVYCPRMPCTQSTRTAASRQLMLGLLHRLSVTFFTQSTLPEASDRSSNDEIRENMRFPGKNLPELPGDVGWLPHAGNSMSGFQHLHTKPWTLVSPFQSQFQICYNCMYICSGWNRTIWTAGVYVWSRVQYNNTLVVD